MARRPRPPRWPPRRARPARSPPPAETIHKIVKNMSKTLIPKKKVLAIILYTLR